MTSTETDTKTTANKFKFGWIGKAGMWISILAMTQVPSLWRATTSGINAANHVCQMAYEGHSTQSIVKSKEGDRSFNYPKRWEGLAKFALTSELKNCPPVMAAIKHE